MGLSSALGDPLPGLGPSLVEGEQTSLATTLDELVRLRNELGVVDPCRDLGVGGDRAGCGVPGDLSYTSKGVLEVGFDLGMGRNCGCTLEPVCEQELGVVFADG